MIEIKNITFAYEKDTILEELNLSIENRESVVILGDNGSGKTTLCNIIAGIYPVKNGTVVIDGKSTLYWRKNKIPKVGILFQNPDNQFIRYRVIDEIELTFKYITKTRTMFNTPYDVIRYFKLEDIKNRLINTLSGGEKQKLALACILSYEPEYLILDEPFAHLDPVNEHIIREILREFREKLTVIEVSQKESDFIFNRYIYLSAGKIVFDGDYKKFAEFRPNSFDMSYTINWLKTKGIDIPRELRSKTEIEKYIEENYVKH
ncbi:MAG: ATP-binding cassette domain-containing protein [Proteobacteria bacterium]|nr:ATP-binding cassette domain-containing protein [Pseudomonadota bacterium]